MAGFSALQCLIQSRIRWSNRARECQEIAN